ncbi:MAG: TRAP transporter small permease [Bacillota bacterium]|nr:TRAP transporter small permease [Bacillota bacterium]
MRHVNKIIEISCELLAIFSGFLIFIMCLLSTYEALSRTVFSFPTKWSLTISVFFMVYAIFLSSAYCFLKEGHIRIELILDKLGGAKRRIVLGIGHLICAVVVGVLGWRGIVLTSRSFAGGWLTQTAFQVPIAYINIAIPIGCCFMLLALYLLVTDKSRIGVR